MSKNFLFALVGGILLLGVFAYFIFNTPPQPEPTAAIPDTQTKQLTTVDKLVVEDITVGSGSAVQSGDTVLMHYRGTLTDGTVFDSSYDRGEPFETSIGTQNVIEGWDKGVPGMKVGGKRKLTIPASMGYGETGSGSIPPNATLIFEVELLEIK